MASLLLRTLILLIASVGVLCSQLPTEVENGFFPTRSGDLVIQPASSGSGKSFLGFIGTTPSFGKNIVLKETQVADILSHLLGTAPLNPEADRSVFPERPYFVNPSANLLFSLDIDTESLREIKSLASSPLTTIAGESYPFDSITTLTSLLSGTTASKHGIVKETWFDKEHDTQVTAYESWCPVASSSRSAALQDIAALAYNGRSLFVSFSSKLSFARALATKSYLLRETSKSASFYYNGESIESVYPEEKQNVKINNEFETLLSKFDAIKYDKDANVVRYSFEGSEYVLDLSIEEVRAFLAECAFVGTVSQLLEERSDLKALLEDVVPDFYSFAFSSLRNLKSRLGHSSVEYKAALSLVDAAISKMVAFVNRAYKGKALSEFLVLAESNNVATKEILKRTDRAIHHQVAADLDIFYPSVYLNSETEKGRETACEKLGDSLSSVGAGVHCLNGPIHHQSRNSAFMRNDVGNDTGDGELEDEVATFQIVLWGSIVLILATLTASVLMLTIDASGDTMVYNQHNQILIKTI